MKRDEIDDAIDAAVRQIMRTEPPAGLRARVMGQLSAPDRGRFMTRSRLAAAAAFAVCLVTGLVWTRDPTTSGEPPVRTVDVAASPASTAPATRPPAAAPARRVEPPPERVVRGASIAARGRQSAAGERLVSAMSIDETAAALPIAPLKPIPAIDATPLIAPPVRINQLAIPPLEMDPVRVEPLLSPPR